MKRRIRGASIGWRLKQLLPLSYATISRPAVDGVEKDTQFVTWRMWFGRCFNVVRTPV